MKVQSRKALEAETRAVARGEMTPPPDAKLASVESAEALIRLPTPDNRRLLRMIRDAKPQSVDWNVTF
jgi:predicted transcriptional regulator